MDPGSYAGGCRCPRPPATATCSPWGKVNGEGHEGLGPGHESHKIRLRINVVHKVATSRNLDAQGRGWQVGNPVLRGLLVTTDNRSDTERDWLGIARRGVEYKYAAYPGEARSGCSQLCYPSYSLV